MILIDTSIWIDLMGKRPRVNISEGALGLIATTPPVIQEVLQGIRSDLHHRKMKDAMLSFYMISVEDADYLEASEIFRLGRRRGITVRSPVDCLIAALAIRKITPIWSLDRDFDQIAKYTSLRIHDRSEL